VVMKQMGHSILNPRAMFVFPPSGKLVARGSGAAIAT
jgi:hypothetical protein